MIIEQIFYEFENYSQKTTQEFNRTHLFQIAILLGNVPCFMETALFTDYLFTVK